jgi:hypothetical protein
VRLSDKAAFLERIRSHQVHQGLPLTKKGFAMTQRHITTSLLLSGLLAFAGFAQAQSGSASATSNVPPKAGEASTMTQGRPNASTNNTPGSTGTSATTGSTATTGASGSGTQGGASATSNVPPKAGEASTMTQGRPNASTNNAPGSMTGTTGTSGSMGSMSSGATSQGGASATSSVPPKAGEASTSVRGQPNANPNNPALTKSRDDIRAEKEMKKSERQARRQTAVMSQKGAQSGASSDTSYNTPAGTPSARNGGTPK